MMKINTSKFDIRFILTLIIFSTACEMGQKQSSNESKEDVTLEETFDESFQIRQTFPLTTRSYHGIKYPSPMKDAVKSPNIPVDISSDFQPENAACLVIKVPDISSSIAVKESLADLVFSGLYSEGNKTYAFISNSAGQLITVQQDSYLSYENGWARVHSISDAGVRIVRYKPHLENCWAAENYLLSRPTIHQP